MKPLEAKLQVYYLILLVILLIHLMITNIYLNLISNFLTLKEILMMMLNPNRVNNF